MGLMKFFFGDDSYSDNHNTIKSNHEKSVQNMISNKQTKQKITVEYIKHIVYKWYPVYEKNAEVTEKDQKVINTLIREILKHSQL